MRTVFLLFVALLSGCALFVAATGLLSTTLALQAGARGLPDGVTGIVMAAYFVGFVVGTYVCPRIISGTGHIRAFAAFAGGAAASVLLHALVFGAIPWAALRFSTGICVVGLYMVTESWLNEKATNQNRGRLFAAYQVVSLLSLAVGQWLLLLASTDATPLIICGVLFAIGLIPVALTKVPEPSPIPAVRLDLGHVWRTSPLGVLGTFMAALVNGVFFSLGPLFVRGVGFSDGQIVLFMSVVILGGVALQWPIGHLSDSRDRRTIILVTSAAAAGLAALAALAAARVPLLFYLSAFLYGGFTFSVYPLCVSHSNDHAPAGEFVKTAGSLLLVYGIGAATGPTVMGVLMGLFGPTSFFWCLAGVYVVLTGFTLQRMLARAAPGIGQQGTFAMLNRTSPSVLQMLPEDNEGD